MKECYELNHIVELNEMNEREGRKRLILRTEKRNDCFEREIECVFVFSSTMRERERLNED